MFFRNIADFEADNGINVSIIGDKTNNIHKQNLVCNGYFFIPELNVVLHSGFQKSPLGHENLDWFVNEVKKLENRMNFYLKKIRNNILMTQENEQDYKNKSICRFCEKNIESVKVRDFCHLTGKHRRPAHSTCNFIATQKQSTFIPFLFHKFSNYDCHLFS